MTNLYLPINSKHIPINELDIRRFWSFVDKSTDCWLWTGNLSYKGYGTFILHKHLVKAHRVGYVIQQGNITDTDLILHKPPCTTRNCVRHLYAGTPADNTRDTVESGHACTIIRRGENCPTSILKNNDVLEIRRKYATGQFTYNDLAIEYEVVFQTIAKIVKRETWTNI